MMYVCNSPTFQQIRNEIRNGLKFPKSSQPRIFCGFKKATRTAVLCGVFLEKMPPQNWFDHDHLSGQGDFGNIITWTKFYLDPPRGAQWMVRGAMRQPLRVQTPPLGGCWYRMMDVGWFWYGCFSYLCQGFLLGNQVYWVSAHATQFQAEQPPGPGAEKKSIPLGNFGKNHGLKSAGKKKNMFFWVPRSGYI